MMKTFRKPAKALGPTSWGYPTWLCMIELWLSVCLDRKRSNGVVIMNCDHTGRASTPEETSSSARQSSHLACGETSPCLFYPRLLALLAGVTSGVLAFGIGEAFHDWFPPERVPQMLAGTQVMEPTLATRAAATARNGALAFALLGGCLGFLLGFAGGLASRSVSRGLSAGIIGLFLGAALGACLPLALLVPYFRFQQWRYSDDLLVPLAMHATLWGPLGAVGGLAFGVGLASGNRGRLILLALLGACLGAALYEVLGAMIDPLAETTEPMSGTWPTRLIARLLVALGTGGAISLAGLTLHRERTPNAPR
jgi:hypothetical protein